jgi:hypothetical protein
MREPDHQTPAVPSDRTDTHAPGTADDRVDRVGRVVLGEDLRTVAKVDQPASRFDPLQHRFGDIFEGGHADQQGQIKTPASETATRPYYAGRTAYAIAPRQMMDRSPQEPRYGTASMAAMASAGSSTRCETLQSARAV